MLRETIYIDSVMALYDRNYKHTQKETRNKLPKNINIFRRQDYRKYVFFLLFKMPSFQDYYFYDVKTFFLIKRTFYCHK